MGFDRAKFTNTILKFFEEGRKSYNANLTWVTLMPKFEGAAEVKDFRPVSMVYKVISKIIVRRIKEVVPKVVGEAQIEFH